MSLFWIMTTGPSVPGLSVSPSTSNIIKSVVGATCYAVIEFSSTGIEYANTPGSNTAGNQSRGNWLDSGAASDVWVEDVSTVGDAWSVSAGAGRLNLGTSRKWYLEQNSGIGEQTRTADFDFWDASSGGNLIASVSYTMTAEWSI